MEWKITYFNESVYANLMNWPKKILAKYLRITELMEKEGADLGMPFTRALGDSLFEIRQDLRKTRLAALKGSSKSSHMNKYAPVSPRLLPCDPRFAGVLLIPT